jgi:hypothetical protein
VEDPFTSQRGRKHAFLDFEGSSNARYWDQGFGS